MKEEKQPNKLFSRIDIIGQNGNTGEHYEGYESLEELEKEFFGEWRDIGESGPMEFSHTPMPTPPCSGHDKESELLNDAEDEIGYIASTIAYAQEDGLLPEVIYQALLEMKQNPDLSPSEALQFGYSEWCK